jgi:protein-S-isoprenylcysteine O-methyltransferase Ste14
MLIGLFLTWWARVHLGRLWSGVITRKEHHRLIETGPYAFVRHPIYTGLFIAAIRDGGSGSHGPSVARGSSYELWLLAEGPLGGAEQFLRIELGPESYHAYCRRVPRLVPFILRRAGLSERNPRG